MTTRGQITRWADLPAVPVRAYSQLEIAGEKLRCVLQRLQCRDLIDLDAMLEDAVDLHAARQLFERKAIHRGFDPATFAEKFEQRMLRYEQRWTVELADYLAQVPDFDELARRVRRKLRTAGLLVKR
jgi:predicted nucleotidyltransferase component of viral defense system